MPLFCLPHLPTVGNISNNMVVQVSNSTPNYTSDFSLIQKLLLFFCCGIPCIWDYQTKYGVTNITRTKSPQVQVGKPGVRLFQCFGLWEEAMEYKKKKNKRLYTTNLPTILFRLKRVAGINWHPHNLFQIKVRNRI